MISKQAQEGFEHVFRHGLKESLSPLADDDCVLTVLPDLAEAKEPQVVILTISSFLLRLIVLIHFTPDATTKEHFARINNKPLAEMDVQTFYDTVSECGNMCCGILNRDLLTTFPHMGLSTPNILDKQCAAYLDILKYGHIKHIRVDINNSVRFHATLCVCEHTDLDFAVDVDAEESTGELEMF
ncbi:hypothetical protein [Rhodoferax sp.]|uniref:hypothetical protein n=1 Tax=Rhodoferax sp. TaxID=50421 RepID=UPI0027520CB1|nr:hypothetical protein [Rhodoferax sp.]